MLLLGSTLIYTVSFIKIIRFTSNILARQTLIGKKNTFFDFQIIPKTSLIT